ncbi:MAG: magnesium transporter CorA family protein [Chloroflexia bacterium]
MFKTLLCDENNQFLVVDDPTAISNIVQRKQRHLWLDLERPTPKEIETIQEEFVLHPLAIEDATRRHQRPKVDQYESFYFVVFYSVVCEEPGQGVPAPGRRGLSGTRFHSVSEGSNTFEAARAEDQQNPGAAEERSLPAMAPTDERIVLREISMFMGENYLITVHEDPIPEFDEVARRWFRNVQSIVGESGGNSHVPGTRELTPSEAQNLKPKLHESPDTMAAPRPPAGDGEKAPDRASTLRVYNPPDDVEEGAAKASTSTSNISILLYSLLDTIVDGYFPVIDGLVDKVEDLEEQIFQRYSQQAIESIFVLKKDLLALRKVLAPERDVLNVLTRRDIPIFDEHTLVYFQDVYDHIVRITDSIDTYRDLLSSALDSFLSMQSNRLNITVQTLTSVSIMLMTISTFTGWFGMNFHNMPELSSEYGYPIMALSLVVVVGLEFAFFKRKRWL